MEALFRLRFKFSFDFLGKIAIIVVYKDQSDCHRVFFIK